VLAARFDSEGRLVTSGRDQTVRVWDVDGNEIKKFKLETGIPLSNAITNQRTTVIIGDSAGNLQFNKL